MNYSLAIHSMKKYFVALILVCLSFYLGQWWAQGRLALEKVAIQASVSEIENTDIPSLQSSVSNEDRLQKLNIIYEKMLKIFLGDLALHLDMKKWQQVHGALNTLTSTVPLIPSAPAIEKTSEEAIVIEKINNTEAPAATIGVDASQEIVIEENKNSNELKKISNPTEFLQLSKIVTGPKNALMQKLSGRFEGVANISIPKKTKWNISLDINLTHDGKKWSGPLVFEMTDEQGHIFSATRGTGDNNFIRTHPGFPKSIIIETSPKSFLQLNWSEQKQKFYGNVYEENKKELKWQWIGSIPFIVAK
jgi:hypothetical protein